MGFIVKQTYKPKQENITKLKQYLMKKQNKK